MTCEPYDEGTDEPPERLNTKIHSNAKVMFMESDASSQKPNQSHRIYHKVLIT